MSELYEEVHKAFMRARTIAHAMNHLDPSINLGMKTKIVRLNYLNSLPQDVLDDIRCSTCKSGGLCNSEADNLYICPENPMKQIVVDFIEQYIGNPWPSEKFEISPIQLKKVVLGLSSPALGILASRGMGKSVALALIAIIWCFFCAKGEDVFIVAPTTMQTDKVYEYVTAFIQSGKENLLMTGDPSIGYEGIDGIRWGQKPMIEWRQGTKFRPACASPTNHGNTMRGQQPTFEIIDESSYIGDTIYYRTLKAGMASKRSDHDNIIIESGTPDAKNHFYDMINDKNKFGHYLILNFDYQDGLRCNRYTQQKINELMAEAGGYDSEEFKSEYRNVFPESITSFFKEFDHVFSNSDIELMPMPGMTYIAGLDLGRINDSTVLTIGRYEVKDDGDRVDVVHIMELHPSENLTYPEQYERICNELRLWKVQTCFIDYTGPGIPIYESLVALASSRNLSVDMRDFSFQAHNKYPQFLRLRSLMQNKPMPRVRYPRIDHEKIKSHPDYDSFLKADVQFRDIIQKRTNSANEATKYKVEPSKQKNHDDFVASCICLIGTLSDSFTNNVAIVAINKDKYNKDEPKKEKFTFFGKTKGGKYFNSKSKHNIWRQI